MPGKKPIEHATDLSIVIGQLLEATTAASDGLKTISSEVQKHAQAVVTAVRTLEMVEEHVREIDNIVQNPTNSDNLVRAVQDHSEQLKQLKDSVQQLRTTVRKLAKSMGVLQDNDVRETASRATLVFVAKIVAWIICTFLAVWAGLQTK